MQKCYIKHTTLPEALGIGGAEGLVNRWRDKGQVDVLAVSPIDGGLSGPHRLSDEDIELEEEGHDEQKPS